MPERSNL